MAAEATQEDKMATDSDSVFDTSGAEVSFKILSLNFLSVRLDFMTKEEARVFLSCMCSRVMCLVIITKLLLEDVKINVLW